VNPVQRSFVTVVSGAPRSGTSMMMRMLDAGGIPALTDGIRAPDRDNPQGYFEFEPVKKTREDSSWVAGAAGRAVKMVHVLLRDLPKGPDYRVLLMRRNLGEMIVSQKRMLERLGKDAGGLSDERMAQIFRAQLDETEKWLRATPGFAVCATDFNALVASPREHLERISEFLGGGLDLDAMAAVVDPGLYRNRG
jgi:hypothetical protein